MSVLTLSQDGCIVITRILGGGLAEHAGVLELGDIVLEVRKLVKKEYFLLSTKSAEHRTQH